LVVTFLWGNSMGLGGGLDGPTIPKKNISIWTYGRTEEVELDGMRRNIMPREEERKDRGGFIEEGPIFPKQISGPKRT